MQEAKTVAIACQGGGSHCAFGAGVLIEVLDRLSDDRLLSRGGRNYRIGGFSGTSGGAVNAVLAWAGLVGPTGPAGGVAALQGFWREIMATTHWDALVNATIVNTIRLQGVVPLLDLAPNAQSDWSQARLRAALEAQVRFDDFAHWARDDIPDLFIGAANVVTGEFTVFGGSGRSSVVDAQQILASAAVPELFHSVQIGESYYWDGLLSQNPPIRDFLRGRTADRVPDEIWIIRINPVGYEPVPVTLADIRDRRNEMAGNLALEEEKYFIGQVNNWVRQGLLPHKKHVALHEIALEEKGRPGDGLDYASKLDRSPGFIEKLLARGRAAAIRFLG